MGFIRDFFTPYETTGLEVVRARQKKDKELKEQKINKKIKSQTKRLRDATTTIETARPV